MYRDYYKILGVRIGATKDEIKDKFRELAKQYHPDVNKEKDAAEKFRLILEAYQVLYDEDKRKRYDELREQIRKGQIDPAMFEEFEEYLTSVRQLIDLLLKLERYDVEMYAINFAGIIGGGLGGAWAGFKLGGIWGAIAGAVIGSIAGGSGSEKVIEEVERKREDGGRKKLTAEMKSCLKSLPEPLAKPIAEFVILSSTENYIFPVAERNIVTTSQYSAIHRIMYNFLSRYGSFKTGFLRKHTEIKETFIEFARKFENKIYEENGIPLQLEMEEVYGKILYLKERELEEKQNYRKKKNQEILKISLSIAAIYAVGALAMSLVNNQGQNPAIVVPSGLFLVLVIVQGFIRRFIKSIKLAREKLEEKLKEFNRKEDKLWEDFRRLKEKFSAEYGVDYDVEARCEQDSYYKELLVDMALSDSETNQL